MKMTKNINKLFLKITFFQKNTINVKIYIFKIMKK